MAQEDEILTDSQSASEDPTLFEESVKASYIPSPTYEEKSFREMMEKSPTLDDNTFELISRTVGLKADEGTTLRSAVVRAFTKPRFDIDPSFEWTPDSYARYTQGIPSDYQDEILTAGSLEEAEFIRNDIEKRMENELAISNFGFAGFTARIMADITDPVFLSSLTVAGKILSPVARSLGMATRGSKAKEAAEKALLEKLENAKKLFPDGKIPQDALGVIFRESNKAGYNELYKSYAIKAMMGGGAFGAVESLRAWESPILDEEHVLHGAITGALLSVAFSAVANKIPNLSIGSQNLYRRWNNGEFGNSPTPKGAAFDAVTVVPPKGLPTAKTPKTSPEVPKVETPTSRVSPSKVDSDIEKLIPKEELNIARKLVSKKARPNVEPASMEEKMATLRPKAKQLGITPARSIKDTVDRINKKISEIAQKEYLVTKGVVDANPRLAESPNVKVVKTKAKAPKAEELQPTVSSEQFIKNLEATTGELDMASIRKAMPSLHVMGLSHDNAIVRWLTSKTHQSLVPLRDPITRDLIENEFVAVTQAEEGAKKLMNPVADLWSSSFKTWALNNGHSLVKAELGGKFTEAFREFDKLVAKQVRGIYKGNDPQVIEVAEAVSNVLQASENSLIGKYIDKAFDNPNYLPRNWDLPVVVDKMNKYGYKAIEEAIITAGARATPKLSPQAQRYKGKLLTRDLYQRQFNADYSSEGLHTGDNKAETKAKLEALEAPDDVITELLNDFFPPTKGSIRSLKKRAELDEGYTVNLQVKEGDNVGAWESFSIDSLFVEGAFTNVFNHVRSIQGALQVHKIGTEFNIAKGMTDNSFSTFKEMWSHVEKTLIETQVKTGDIKEHFEIAEKMIMGRPIYDTQTGLAVAATAGRAVSSMMIGGIFGIATLAEAFMPIANTSINAFFKQIPSFKEFVSLMRTGKPLEGTLINELDLFAPVRTNRLMSQTTALHDSTLEASVNQGKILDKLNMGQHLTYVLGLTIPITDTFRNITSASFAQQNYIDAIKGTSSYSVTRRKQYGWNDATTEQILKMFKTHGKVDKNGKLISANFDKWTDTDAVLKYAKAQVFHANRTIHQVMTGQIPKFAHGALGQVLTQFMRFPMTAVDSQVMTALQERDKRAAFVWLSNLLGGALSYITYIHHRYGGDKEKLEKYLTTEEIAKGAFYRSGFSTIMPMIIDTARDFSGLNPMFSHGRAVGLATDVWGGSPVGGLLKSVQGAGRGVIASMFNSEYEFSETDWRHVRNLIPLQNSMYLHRILSKVPDWLDLPEKSKGN